MNLLPTFHAKGQGVEASPIEEQEHLFLITDRFPNSFLQGRGQNGPVGPADGPLFPQIHHLDLGQGFFIYPFRH